MSEDLISNNFVDTIDKRVIKKYLLVLKILLSLAVIYSCLELAQWYFFLDKKLPGNIRFVDFYNYRILPYVGLALLILNVISWLFYFRGNKLLYKAFENNEALSLNEGYKDFYRSALITITAFIIGICNLVIRFTL